jgi:hypothetical protein
MVPEDKQNKKYKQINFIGLQNNRHPSQYTVGKFHKASGNCQQRPLFSSVRIHPAVLGNILEG